MAGQLQSEDWVLSLRSPKAGPTSPKKAFLPDSLELAEASDAPPLPKGLQPKKKLGHLAPILRPSGHKPHAAKGTTLQGGKTGPLAAQKTTVSLPALLAHTVPRISPARLSLRRDHAGAYFVLPSA